MRCRKGGPPQSALTLGTRPCGVGIPARSFALAFHHPSALMRAVHLLLALVQAAVVLSKRVSVDSAGKYDEGMELTHDFDFLHLLSCLYSTPYARTPPS